MTGEAPPPERDDDVAPPGEVRASHEDRDRAAELLRMAAGDGRLTADELDQRLEQALTAHPRRARGAEQGPAARAGPGRGDCRGEAEKGHPDRASGR